MQGKIGQMFFAATTSKNSCKMIATLDQRSLDAGVAAELSYDWVRRMTSFGTEPWGLMELRDQLCDNLWDLTQPGGRMLTVHIGHMKDKLPCARREWSMSLLRPPTPNQLRALAIFLRADSRILHAASVFNTAAAWEAARGADLFSQMRRGASSCNS